MAEKMKNVAEAVKAIAQPTAQTLGVKVWDVVFQKEGPSLVLRIIIDREGGVFIEDCENLSRAVDPLIDEANLIEAEYCFEVSSPGLMRELRTEEHFAAYVGKGVVVKLYKPDEDKSKEYTGKLVSFGETIVIDTENGTKEFVKDSVASVKADDDVQIGGIKK